MPRDDRAVAQAPVVLQAHEADAALAGELGGFRKRELTFRFDQSRFEETLHGRGVAAACGLPAGFRRAERFHVKIEDAALGEAGGEHVLGKAGAARIGDFAHVHQHFHLGGFERGDEVADADTLVADGPDAAQL